MIPEIISNSPYFFADPDQRFYREMLLIQLPEHNLRFDEKIFLHLLATSVSLTPEEKRKIIEQVPRLSQQQVDHLLRILVEEVTNFRALDQAHASSLEALEKRSQKQWKLLEAQLVKDWHLAVRSLVFLPSAEGLSVRCFTTFTPTLVNLVDVGSAASIATPFIEDIGASTRISAGEVLQEFEGLINEPGATEHQLHAFLKGHPEFLLGVDYRCLHSSVLLTSDEKGKRQADFMLEYHDQPYADILELKRPQDRIYCSVRSIRHLAGAVSRAIAQLHLYGRYFEETNWRREFMHRNGFTAYKPTFCLVIGRTTELTYEEMRDAETLQAGVKIWTYDDLRRRAQRFYQYQYGLKI